MQKRSAIIGLAIGLLVGAVAATAVLGRYQIQRVGPTITRHDKLTGNVWILGFRQQWEKIGGPEANLCPAELKAARENAAAWQREAAAQKKNVSDKEGAFNECWRQRREIAACAEKDIDICLVSVSDKDPNKIFIIEPMKREKMGPRLETDAEIRHFLEDNLPKEER